MSVMFYLRLFSLICNNTNAYTGIKGIFIPKYTTYQNEKNLPTNSYCDEQQLLFLGIDHVKPHASIPKYHNMYRI